MAFECPNCKKEIDDKIISKYFASKGGSKSKRKLDPEKARDMVRKREEKREDTIEQKKG